MSTAPSPDIDDAEAGIGRELRLTGLGYAYGARRRRGPQSRWQLRGIDLTFRAGVITGLLGRNGAGKSTLLDVCAGLRRPSAGAVALDGQPVWDTGARASIALLGTRRALLESSRLTDSAAVWAATRPRWSSQDLARYLALLEIDPGTAPRRLSQGQRSAVDAAFALASHSPVLLLDEVHLGMDAVVRRRFWDALLEQYAAERPTIVISSHEIGEIEDLVEDIAVIDRGALAASGTADDLRAAATAPGRPLADLTDVLAGLTSRKENQS